MNLDNLPAELDRVIKAAGVAIVSVSIGNPLDKTTWKVQPSSLQSAAQPMIDAFNVNDPSHDSAQLNLEVTGHLDNERLYSAIVWVLMRTIFPTDTVAQTKAKFNAQPNGARQQIIDAFKAQPWKP